MDPAGQHRDMMYCHECHDEWYRDEHGLTCPECGSDFTEIIEEDHDPRDHDDDDDDSMPDLEDHHPQHPLHHHDPFQPADDPEEGDISRLQWRQVGPGRFSVTGTVYRTVSPHGQGRDDGGANALGGFASILNNMIGGAARGQPAPEDAVHRFSYTSSARLAPRDAINPQAHMEPVDEMTNVLVGLMATFGEAPGGPNAQHPHGHPPHANGPGGGQMPFHPILALLNGMRPGNGTMGDFVYSQEGLDRIISQLMEQTQSSNAPGPASQQEIDALVRKPVTTEMLGSEGRADCSICMEEVNIGEEVTELPCHHWFHHPCVAAWLAEHDTCPHCRQGISKHERPSNTADGNTGASGVNNHGQMPGSFAMGDGPANDATLVQENWENSGSSQQDSSSGGIGDRIRRGLFGPPHR
ncbi:hypothetical protein EJ04DRAFT_149695 [Polyplosphaeria fusca]|uniref:RING-type E3 ubiquitin transferase n=1 Tax=Polyplosphaeria fusca TaxID=682080 RepID=A0A9P4V4T9_9PLEO|nr:hypothetical protein EJ04DRAFT_149695 [Polyplosphaeria fusca]